MARIKSKYKDVRKKMKPGDVIAFGGKGNFSEIIKWATRSTVSHVGVILQSKLLIDKQPQAGFFNQIIDKKIIGFSFHKRIFCIRTVCIEDRFNEVFNSVEPGICLIPTCGPLCLRVFSGLTPII